MNKPRKLIPVQLSKWGFDCFVKELTGRERRRYIENRVNDADIQSCRLICMCLCDGNYHNLLQESDAEKVLDTWSDDDLASVINTCCDLNGFGKYVASSIEKN
jgi:hypothetical protein